MIHNVGRMDRLVRAAIGLALVVLALYWGCWFTGIVGLGFAFSAAAGWCGLYKILGISTCKIKS
jgi:hypothetical protein